MTSSQESGRGERRVQGVVACGVGFLLLWNLIDGPAKSLADADRPTVEKSPPVQQYQYCPTLPDTGQAVNADQPSLPGRYVVSSAQLCSTPMYDNGLERVIAYAESSNLISPSCQLIGTSLVFILVRRDDGSVASRGFVDVGSEPFEPRPEDPPLAACQQERPLSGTD